MVAVAILFAIIAAVVWSFGLYMSFTTEGGAIGMVPVLVYAVAAPIFGIFSAAVLRLGAVWHVPIWLVVTAFPVGVVVVGWTIAYAGKLGERAHRRLPKQSH